MLTASTTIAQHRPHRHRNDPVRAFAPACVEVEPLLSGGMVLRSPLPLEEPDRHLLRWLERWALQRPASTFLAQRRAGTEGWRTLCYAEAWTRVRRIAQALLDRELSPDRPILILAENGIDHALMMLSAMQVCIPVAPVSTAYATLSQDFAKLRGIVELIRPDFVFVDDAARYSAALASLDLADAEIVAAGPAVALKGMTAFTDLLLAEPTSRVDQAGRKVGPDTVAKILFTSGSTDAPKGVINTQGMLCTNQQMLAQLWPFLEEEPPILVDWLPWTHTFGGNHNLNMVLRNGGTLYIDDGKPSPALMARSVENLRSVAPTILLNVPRGYSALLEHLEADSALNRHLFSRLKVMFYAAASLPQDLWERLEACSLRARGEVVPMLSAWGLTETAPTVTCGHFPAGRAGIIGLPAPGVELRLEPAEDRMEMLVRGPTVTPGYWKRPDLTEAAFRDGWFRTGDAGRLADPADPAKGILFDGRLSENFKLSTGTWVNVGMLRVGLLAALAPLVDDAVLTGHDGDEIGAILFPNVAACQACAGVSADRPLAEVAAHPSVLALVTERLRAHNATVQGSSSMVMRAAFALQPPSIDAGEITDKGYINQRAVLRSRADLVARLHANRIDAGIIRFPRSAVRVRRDAG